MGGGAVVEGVLWHGSRTWARCTPAIYQAAALPISYTRSLGTVQCYLSGPTLQVLTTWSIRSSTLQVRSSRPLPGVSRISGLAARGLQHAAKHPSSGETWASLLVAGAMQLGAGSLAGAHQTDGSSGRV